MSNSKMQKNEFMSLLAIPITTEYEENELLSMFSIQINFDAKNGGPWIDTILSK